MDIIIILRLIFKPYTKKQKGPVKKYDSRKYIHVRTVDFRPRQELSRPRKYCNKKNQVATNASFIILKPFLKLL